MTDLASSGRIHFSIQYPELDYLARKAIWKTFFDKVAREGNGIISDEDIDRLAKHQMNGRQVRVISCFPIISVNLLTSG